MLGVSYTCTWLLVLFVNVFLAVANTGNFTVQPVATEADCICKEGEAVCRCRFIVEHRVTMVLEKENKLVYVDNGILKFYENGRVLNEDQRKRVIVADGAYSRLVIAINGVFPGPRIEVYEDQVLELTVVNTFHTDSITVHFHGIHQRNTPWMDGVAYITQCPILPGQTFVYRFTAYPPGTNMYHAHIGDQRSMGLYGPFIVRPKSTKNVSHPDEIIVSLQDFNHLMDAETAYQRMISGQFDFNTGKEIKTTYSVDGGKFSRFEFQSGLVNGKGRYWNSSATNNGAPLERFIITPGKNYRFRVIGAMTLYPMRIYIRGETISLRSSDAYNIETYTVQCIIVHPGERYDFTWRAPVSKQETLLVAETIETGESLDNNKYHAAEAILDMGANSKNPSNDKYEFDCTASKPCIVFNCPYTYFPINQHRKCLGFDDLFNIDPARDFEPVLGNSIDEEYFFNFAFPGPPGSPGSVNGHGFIPPTGSLLTQSNAGIVPCNETECTNKGVCECTFIQHIGQKKLVQMVFSNLGSGSGWSHPIHLHGHSFYLMKTGLGTYNRTTGKLIRNSEDIICTDGFGYCSSSAWTNASWADGNVPSINEKPPEKDTVIVPTGETPIDTLYPFASCLTPCIMKSANRLDSYETPIYSASHTNPICSPLLQFLGNIFGVKSLVLCDEGSTYYVARGYVVIRLISDNPGKWFMHCHIDIHNTNGMGMVIEEEGDIPDAPTGFPVCNDFRYSSQDEPYVKTVTKEQTTGYKTATFVFIGIAVLCIIIIPIGIVIYRTCRNNSIELTKINKNSSYSGKSYKIMQR